MNITMIGSGYVGLVSGACFADFGHNVICVDSDATKIDRLKRGEIPIYEPGLDELVANNVQQNRLSFTTDLAPAVKGADAVFIAVGTPSRRGDGHADLSFVYAAAHNMLIHQFDVTTAYLNSDIDRPTFVRASDLRRAPSFDSTRQCMD